MPNHFHFFIRSEDDKQLAKFMKDIQASYAKYLHQKYSSFGHVFQGRYKNKIVNGLEYSLYLTAYIHTNPVVAGLVIKADDWLWSSYRDYKNLRNGKIPNTKILLNSFLKPEDYFNWVEKISEEKIENTLGNLMID